MSGHTQSTESDVEDAVLRSPQLMDLDAEYVVMRSVTLFVAV